jgi:hypothetical protein
LSKEYTNVFIDKLLRGENKAYIKHHLDKFSEDDKIARNISNQRLFEKQKVSTLNKIKSHIDGNMIKTVKIINKSIKTNLLNDFDRDISFINIFNGDKLTMRMPDGAPSKEAVRKILLTDFNREVVFINKINSNIRRLQNGFGDGIEKVSHEMGRLKLLSNIDRLTMMLNINHSRRLPMISIGTGDDYVATHTKTLYNYTRIATLIDIKRKYSKYLFDRIEELIKTSNRITHLNGFFSKMNIKQKEIMLAKVDELDEINKIEYVRKYLFLSFKELLKREILTRYMVKNFDKLNIYKPKFKCLVKHAGFLYRYKVYTRYVSNVYCGLINKININRKYFYNDFAKESIRLKHRKMYLNSGITGIKYAYKYNVNFRGMKHYASYTYRLDSLKKFMDTKIGTSDIVVNNSKMRRYLKRGNMPITVISYGERYLKKGNKEAVKLCYPRFAKQKIKLNMWKVESTFKDIKKVQRKIDKITYRTYLDYTIQRMFKGKSLKFYDIPIALGYKIKNISKLLDKSFVKLGKINTCKKIFRMPLLVVKTQYTRYLDKMLRNLDKVRNNEKLLDLTYRRIYKDIDRKFLDETTTRINHYEPQFRYLDKTWTRIYLIKNITEFLEVKRRWWILEHDGLTDKLIIPNIDYPYETEPIRGIDKHPVSSLATINYADINYGTKEIEVSIGIMESLAGS